MRKKIVFSVAGIKGSWQEGIVCFLSSNLEKIWCSSTQQLAQLVFFQLGNSLRTILSFSVKLLRWICCFWVAPTFAKPRQRNADLWRKTGQIPKVILLRCIWPIYCPALCTRTNQPCMHKGAFKPSHAPTALQTLRLWLCLNTDITVTPTRSQSTVCVFYCKLYYTSWHL